MKKITRLLLPVLVMALAAGLMTCPGVAWGANTDPVHLYPNPDRYGTDTTSEWVYDTNGDFSFQYQLRDVSDNSYDGHTVAGAQWFATIYENWFWERYYQALNTTENTHWGIYRRTTGGAMPAVPMTTSADLLNERDYVYIDEPEPYENWPQYVNMTGDWYDSYMDPVESIFVVIPDGKGALKVDFANHYGRHFPYWWDWDNNPVNPASSDLAAASRDVYEDILMEVDGYDIDISPETPQRIRPGEYLNAQADLFARSTRNYGSTVGYVTFRQSASFDTGYTGFRESTQIPVVVANVHDGLASDSANNNLYFDMLISADGEVVNRLQFRWGAGDDKEINLGTLFSLGSTAYDVETRITNRTGTRYRLQRYDLLRNNTFFPNVNNLYLRPLYWAYDLTTDVFAHYDRLPRSFDLDLHSQIAPGLVTVYRNTLARNYANSDPFFEIYPFSSGTHHTLTLRHTELGGNITALTRTPFTLASRTSGSSSALGLSIEFLQVANDVNNTETQLKNLLGKSPVMVPALLSYVPLLSTNIHEDALNEFAISKDVPLGLVSLDLVVLSRDASGDIVSSDYVSADVPLQPVRLRLRIPRRNLPDSMWTELESAEDSKARIETFRESQTIWLDSANTSRRYRDFFLALEEDAARYASFDVEPSDYVQAFTYNDELYLDFLVILADARGTGNVTAFTRVFKDYNTPYVMIADGAEDGVWALRFCVGAMDLFQYVPPETPASPDQPARNTETSDSGGGGGCEVFSFASSLALGLCFLYFYFARAECRRGD